MNLITIIRIIVGFQGWDEGTLEGLGSSVRHSRSGEQEQYTSIPDWIGRDNESPIVDTRRLIMTRSNRWLPWNGLAGNGLQYTRCTPLYLVCPITRQLKRLKCPLCWADPCSSNVFRRASTCKIMRIKCIMCIMDNPSKNIFNSFSLSEVIPTLGTRTQVNTAINGYADR